MKKIDRLYIHIPFCKKKCSYCAFHSIPASDEILVEKYFAKLEQNIKENKHQTEALESIFIGGGTPSLLSAKRLEKLFSIIKNNFKIKDTAEISIENNPESLTDEKIHLISNFANRISIGIQSFNENHRSIIGRSGSLKNLYHTLEKLINNNIRNISIDLIYGIPTQTLKDWEHELTKVLDLPIKHLSAYSLTYEEGTKLYAQIKTQTSNESDEISADMWQLTSDILYKNNISRYEISNYSQPDYECKHNLDTWYGGQYIGFGPTASSFDGKKRWTQAKLKEWLENKEPELDYLNKLNRTIEIFITGLRTVKGWKIINKENENEIILDSVFHHNLSFKTIEWSKIFNKLIYLSEINLLNIKNIGKGEMLISATAKGLLFWDEIALEILE